MSHLHTRPPLGRTDSSTSLPTPPSTLEEKRKRMQCDSDSPVGVSSSAMDLDDPFASTTTHVTPPSSFSRKRTNRPKNADRISKQAAAAYMERTAALSAALEQDPENPFLERPGEVFRGKHFASRDSGIVNYVFRGKRISFDSAYYAPHDVLEAAYDCPPKLLFPTAEQHVERPIEPMATPKRPLTTPRMGRIVPPTPESIHRPSASMAFKGQRFHPYAQTAGVR